MQTPARIFRPFILTAILLALVVLLNPMRAADKEPTAADLKQRVKELEERVAKLEAQITDAGFGEVTPEEMQKFKQYLEIMQPDDRADAQKEIAKMTASERNQVIHRIAKLPAMDIGAAKKRSQATREIEDLRLLDACVDQYALETDRTSGFHPSFTDLKNYLKAGTTLYNSGADVFGNSYGPFTVDSLPKIPDAAFNVLSDVADASFWSPYK